MPIQDHKGPGAEAAALLLRVWMRLRHPLRAPGWFAAAGTAAEPANAKDVAAIAESTRRRLAEQKASLDELDAERILRDDPLFGRAAEERIIWGELLELELQDVDEQISRTCRGDRGRTRP